MIAGIRTWGPTGLLELDENSFTVRVIFSQVIARTTGQYADYAVPGASPATCSAVAIPIGAYSDPNSSSQDYYSTQFEPEVGNGFVRVWFGNRGGGGSWVALATMRVLVMRYR